MRNRTTQMLFHRIELRFKSKRRADRQISSGQMSNRSYCDCCFIMAPISNFV
jgi:hypothetical protein